MSDEELSGDEMLDQAASQIEQALSEDIVDDVADSDDVVDEVDDYEDDDQEDIEVDDDDESDDPYAALDDFERSEMERARLGGWRPKSEYKGDPKNWKDYDEFNAVGDRIVSNLNTKIDAQSKKIEQQQQAIQKLLKAQGSVIKQAKEQALADLKAQRREAILDGDADTVDELDEKIDETRSEVDDLDFDDEQEPDQPQIDDAVKEFMEQEKAWFNGNTPLNAEMVDYAIFRENQERKRNPNADSAEIMKRVKAAVVREYPDEFKGKKRQRKDRTAQVEGSSRKKSADSVVRMSDFPKEVQELAEFFEKQGTMTKAEYLKSVKEGM